MLDRPPLPDDVLVAHLREHYGLSPTHVEFLPIGNDSSAWAYRAATGTKAYFLKVKRGHVKPVGALVSRYLHDSGCQHVVAPEPTLGGQLWGQVGDFATFLYPWIDGTNGMALGLTEAQWLAYGALLRQLHATHLPPGLRGQVPSETFTSPWAATVQAIERRLAAGDFRDPLANDLAAFWRARQDTLHTLLQRTAELGRWAQARSAEFVLCHADIHTANVLVDAQGQLWVVDWDEARLAPKERDLVFVVGSDLINAERQALFFSEAGYGATNLDPVVLAYYHYEWVVQEIGDFGERIFLSSESGEATRRAAAAGFRQLFQPGDVVDAAFDSDKRLRDIRP